MSAAAPIFLYTDFGAADLYAGQVKAVLHEAAPACTVVDLLNDVPAFGIGAAAHLLAALSQTLPARAVIIAVVDPGVGSARDAIALEADGRWYVGPDNGLLSVVAARAREPRVHTLEGLPPPRYASFHGRDLFAPAAARIATGTADARLLVPKAKLDRAIDAGDLAGFIYIDHYGNAMTGLRAASLAHDRVLHAAGRRIHHARVFSAVAPGELFWYENSIGLVELAANQASAASLLDLRVGQEVTVG